MFRRSVGVGLSALGGAAAGAELAFLLINSRLAELAQDSEGNLLVNNANVYWSLITLGGFSGLLLGSYLGIKLTKAKPTNEARLKAVGYNILAVPDEFCDPVTLSIFEDPVVNPYKITYNRTTLAILMVDPKDPGKRICALTQQVFDPATVVTDEAMKERVESFIQTQVKTQSGIPEMEKGKLAAALEGQEVLDILTADLELSNCAPYIPAGSENANKELQEQEPLLLTAEKNVLISIRESFPLAADLDARLPAEKQPEPEFHLNLKESYFSPSRQAQGGYAAFFPPASNSATKVLQIPAVQTADELEEDGWVLYLAM